MRNTALYTPECSEYNSSARYDIRLQSSTSKLGRNGTHIFMKYHPLFEATSSHGISPNMKRTFTFTKNASMTTASSPRPDIPKKPSQGTLPSPHKYMDPGSPDTTISNFSRSVQGRIVPRAVFTFALWNLTKYLGHLELKNSRRIARLFVRSFFR